MIGVPRFGSIVELFESIDFPPTRIIVSRKLHDAVKQYTIEQVHLQGRPITLRTHPALPENIIVMFGAEGAFAVMSLEEDTDEKCG